MRHRWAVVREMRETGRHPDAPGFIHGRAPGRFRRLLGGLALIEETKLLGPEPIEQLRTVMLLGAAVAGEPTDWAAAVGTAWAVGRIRRGDRDGVIGFFPSLRHFNDVAKFQKAVSLAYQVAEQNRTRLILVGTAAGNLEAGYGLIDPALLSLRRGLLNVSVVVGTVDAFRTTFLATQPWLAVMVDVIASVPRGGDEVLAVEDANGRLPWPSAATNVFARPSQPALVVPLVAGWTDIPNPGPPPSVVPTTARRPAFSVSRIGRGTV